MNTSMQFVYKCIQKCKQVYKYVYMLVYKDVCNIVYLYAESVYNVGISLQFVYVFTL